MSETAAGAPDFTPGGMNSVLDRDERLARRAAAGDRRAFERLFERYGDALYRYCRAILASPEDAEDAVQATMVKALHALPGEERTIAIKPWLHRVAHNESISILRARPRTDELDHGSIEAPSSVELTADMRERVRTLVADLGELPERQRAALVMRELNGLSYEEVGAALSMRPAAARQAVYEARTALFEAAEGREMECAKAREAISAGDRRILRGRRVRAHLRGCEPCRDFDAAIAQRRETLAALAPPLAAPAAVALLHGALGTGASGGGAVGAGVGSAAGGGLASAASVKSAVAVLAIAAIGGGAAATGLLDRHHGAGADSNRPTQPPTGGANDQARSSTAPTDASRASAAGTAVDADSRHERADEGADRGRRHHRHGAKHGNEGAAAGNSASAPGQTGTAPGQAVSESGPTHSNAGGGGTASAPGQVGAAPGQAHSNAGGGGAASAPGRTGSTPAGANSPPGQSQSAPSGAAANGTATGHANAPGQTEK